MALKNNPFFLLRIPCTAGRREIISASEEMGFLLDSETCSNAQNELINLNKRLSAEINWFMDVDESDIDRIRTCIEEDVPISINGLSPLSALNAALHNLSTVTSVIESTALESFVVKIDELFSALDVEAITETINQKRSIARLSSVQVQDVSIELDRKRKEIRQLITEKMTALDQDDYVDLVTALAEKCLSENTPAKGLVVSDIIDQYEVRIQSVLESSLEDVEKTIERIKKIEDASSVASELNCLIDQVIHWDRLAQPLQLKSKSSGMPHQISERLATELRNLSLYLNNEKDFTKEAFKLIDAMKPIFIELGVLSDQIQSDSDQLNFRSTLLSCNLQ